MPRDGGSERARRRGALEPWLREREHMRHETTSTRTHAMGIGEPTKTDLRKRLARIRGQVEGLARMVEEDRYCPDTLHQFAAVRSALRSAEKILLANHLERCATHAIEEGGEGAAEVRREIVDLFHRFVR